MGHVAWTRHRGPRALGVFGVALVTVAVMASSAFGARPASVEGSEFTIEKLQLIADSGDAQYTTGSLIGQVGQTVDYEIIVTNTGDSTLMFSSLKDPNCTGVSPAGATELEPANSETFTCEAVLSAPGAWSNQAEIEAGGKLEASNEVLVEVPEERAFTVQKLQAIKGTDSGFTSAELAGKVGQTVDYEIIVANTGNTTLTFAPLEDANCTEISPAGATEVAAGHSETLTCEHTLTTPGQIWSNGVTVQSGEMSENSNEVFVRTLEEPEFTIETLQEIHGSGAGFTTGELNGKLGETIDYEIVVKNTGKAALAFSPLSDANCADISPAGATELAPGTSETFTCQHALTAVGAWTNQAEIEGALKQKPPIEAAVRPRAIVSAGEAGVKKANSNKVIVNVPAEPNYTVEKLQSIRGSGAGFTTAELQGSVGQVVDYEVIVRNTGNVPLKLSALADPNCANISPSGASELAAGGSETFTCEHTLTSAGSYANEATIEVSGKPETSNKVIVNVPQQQVKAQCTISGSLIVLRGARGSKRKTFTVRIPALGIRQVTFYVDGREVKTLTAGQAKNGEFTVKIDPSKLRYGAHRVSLKTVMSESACGAIARSAVFVHPRPAAVTPKFTG